MELPIEKALQQGITAHKEGNLQEAERFYRAILQAQPLHPDANPSRPSVKFTALLRPTKDIKQIGITIRLVSIFQLLDILIKGLK